MTADIRGTVICDLGDVISGSFSESSSVGSGAITVEGSLTLKGVRLPSEGRAFRLVFYSPVRKTFRQLGPTFYVVNSVYDPGLNTTTVTFGDKLAFVAEYETGPILVSSKDDPNTVDIASDDPELTDLQKKMLIKPLSADWLAHQLASSIGISVPGGLPFTFYREEMKTDGNVLAMLNDLYISANRCLYSSYGDISSFGLGSINGSLRVVKNDDILAITPNGTPIRAATNIYASYDYLQIDTKQVSADKQNENAPDDESGYVPPDEDDLNDNEDTAYCVDSATKAYDDETLYTYREWDIPKWEEKGDEIDLYVQIPNASNTHSCYDKYSRLTSQETETWGQYGKTWNKKVIKYYNGLVGSVPVSDFTGITDNMRATLNNLAYVYGEWLRLKLESAFLKAKNIDYQNLDEETGLPSTNERNKYYGNKLEYTFGTDNPQEFADSVFLWEVAEEEEEEWQPVPIFWESVGLPRAYYYIDEGLAPLIPRTYERFWSGQYKNKYTFKRSLTTSAGTANTEVNWVPNIETTEGSRKVQLYLEDVMTDAKGKPYEKKALLDVLYGGKIFWESATEKIRSMGQYLALKNSSFSVNESRVKFDGLLDTSEYENAKSQVEQAVKEAADELEQKEENPPFTQSLSGNQAFEQIGGGSGTGITYIYKPPYTSDDSIQAGAPVQGFKTFTVKKSDADQQARAYARTQNQLRRGKARGLNVTLPIDYYSCTPHSGLALSYGTIAGAYICDASSVTFDPTGIVFSADLLYIGGVV